VCVWGGVTSQLAVIAGHDARQVFQIPFDTLIIDAAKLHTFCLGSRLSYEIISRWATEGSME
jgi:hypothetical protein